MVDSDTQINNKEIEAYLWKLNNQEKFKDREDLNLFEKNILRIKRELESLFLDNNCEKRTWHKIRDNDLKIDLEKELYIWLELYIRIKKSIDKYDEVKLSKLLNRYIDYDNYELSNIEYKHSFLKTKKE